MRQSPSEVRQFSPIARYVCVRPECGQTYVGVLRSHPVCIVRDCPGYARLLEKIDPLKLESVLKTAKIDLEAAKQQWRLEHHQPKWRRKRK